MNIRRLFATILVGTMLFNIPVYAEENIILGTESVEFQTEIENETESLSVESETVIDEKKLEEIETINITSEETSSVVDYNGHSYKIISEGLTWEEAKLRCESLGGHLVTITTSEEQEFIETLLNDDLRNNYWIGGEKVNGQFCWITNEPFEYTNWAYYMPDNSEYVEDKLHLYNKKNPNSKSEVGQWNDLRNEGVHGNEKFFGLENFGFICEWETILEDEIEFFEIGIHSNKFSHSDIGVPHPQDNNVDKVGKVYTTSLMHYNKLISGLTSNEAGNILDIMNGQDGQKEWTGSCFGASLSMALAHQNIFDIKSLGATLGYFTLQSPKVNIDLRDAINFYHLIQYRKEGDNSKLIFKSGMINFAKWLVTDEKIVFNEDTFWENFLENVKKSVREEKPILFSMGYGEDSGHTVIVCGLKESDKYYIVKLYDLNSRSDYLYLYISKDYKQFFCSFSNDVDKQSSKYYAHSDDWRWLGYNDIDSVYESMANVGNASYINHHASKGKVTTICSVSAFNSFKMTNEKGEYISYNGECYEGNMSIYDFRIVGEGSEQKILIEVDQSNLYCISEFEDDTTFWTYIDNKYYIANATNAEQINFSNDDGITIIGENFAFLSGLSVEGDYRVVKTKGKAKSCVNMNYSDAGVSLSSEEAINGVEINRFSEKKDDIYEINENVTEIEIDLDSVEEKVKYTIYYDANGGKNAPEFQQIRDGEKLQLPVNVPTRDGYTFIGWYSEKTGGTKVTSDMLVTKDITLYAHWRKNETKPQEKPTYTGVEAFVAQLYRVCLGRKPDEAGLVEWTNKLTSKQIDGVTAAYGFVFSPEFKDKNLCNEDYVKQLYEAFLGRTPDKVGLEEWINQLENGTTREYVFNGFALSSEFKNLCEQYGINQGSGIPINGNSTTPTGKCSICGKETKQGVESFVMRLYNVCLNRNADAVGLKDWSEKLKNHTSTGRDVAYGFIFSSEFINKNYSNEDYVEYLYNAFMGRGSDPVGKTDWLNRMDNDWTREQVFNGFVGSQEFTEICNRYGITRD